MALGHVIIKPFNNEILIRNTSVNLERVPPQTLETPFASCNSGLKIARNNNAEILRELYIKNNELKLRLGDAAIQVIKINNKKYELQNKISTRKEE